MQSKERPYVLFVAEKIYLEISKIKRNNIDFSNIDSIEAFIGSETYKEISSGKFHDKWFKELEKNNFIDKKTKKKIPVETVRLIKIQKDMMVKQLVQFPSLYYTKVTILLNFLKEHSIIYGRYVKVLNYGAKKVNK